MERELAIIDGPDKPALQWSLTKPVKENDVRFSVKGDAFEARIVRMEEGADGFTFELDGHLTSGNLKGAPFQAVYSVESRSGSLRIDTNGE